MSHPDITAALEAGERLLWQGHPKKGRRAPRRAKRIAAGFFAASAAFVIGAGWLEIFHGHLPVWHLLVYALIATAAFLTYIALRLTLLDTRRARARDARTAYGITDRRALTLAGPYRAELPLTPGVSPEVAGDSLTIANETDRLRFERLDDASAARDILMRQIEGRS